MYEKDPTTRAEAAQQLLNADHQLAPEIVPLLKALEQCIVTLDKITKNQASSLYALPRRVCRAKITEQTNILTNIILKTLPKPLGQFADPIYRAECAVLMAYMATLDPGRERMYLWEERLRLNKEKIEWDELIAIVKSLNNWGLLYPFVDGLYSLLDATSFVIEPVKPSRGSLLVKAMQSNNAHIKMAFHDFSQEMHRWNKAAQHTATASLQRLVGAVVQWGKEVKYFWKAMHSLIKKWMDKPLPPIRTQEGFYIAPPIADEKKSLLPSRAIVIHQLKTNIHDALTPSAETRDDAPICPEPGTATRLRPPR